jgi:hypothetical protein
MTTERDFGNLALVDLAVASAGQKIFVRQVPRELVTHSSGTTYEKMVGAGELVALDTSLVEIERIDIEALVVQRRLDGIGTRAVRIAHDPRGWAFAIQCFDRIADFGFGKDEYGSSRTGEAWSSYSCTNAKMFSSARYHPSNGDLVFVEEGSIVRTAHAHLDWPGVAAYTAVMNDERIAAIGPKYLQVYDRVAGAEAFRVAAGPGYSVGLLSDSRVAVLGGKKPRLRVLDATGEQLLCLLPQGFTSTASIEVSPSGILAIVGPHRVAFVDPTTARVAVLPDYGHAEDTRAGQFAWLTDQRIVVIWPGTGRLSIVDVGDAFTTLPSEKWKKG